MFTFTSSFKTTTTYKNSSWILQLVVWEGEKKQKQVLIDVTVFVFPNSFVYANSNLDFRENRILVYHKNYYHIFFLVKKIMFILVTKKKKRYKMCLGFVQCSNFLKMPYNSQAG